MGRVEALNPSRNQIIALATMLNISNDIFRFRTAKLKAMCRGRLNMRLLFLVALLLALEGCQDTGRFEATQIGPLAISNGATAAAN